MLILYDIVNMLGPNQHQETPGESRIDKMRKFLSSPLMRRKPTVLQLKTFGTPLDTLLQRTSSSHSVPFIITRLCEYIKQAGLTHEGLFRISGNARSVERLRASFDRSGDAPLETEGDVPSAAALLKLFLRELPDPIIPLSMHCQFLNAVKDKDKSECILSLTDLVDKLPVVNYCILSYLTCFLKEVSDLEDQNRMSASSLGIVFGPNLFRVTEDFVGLKEQSLTNQIVTYFITNHQDIFKKDTYFPENSDISSTSISNSNHQVPAMVSSWPETKACSSAMLSSWSLGPISIPMHSSDDTYLPLCPVSYSIEQASSSSFALCKQEEIEFPSISQPDFAEKKLSPEFSVHQSEIIEDDSYEDFSATSGLSGSLENQSLQSHSELSHSNNFSEIETELSVTFKECSLAGDSTSFSSQLHFTSAHKNSFDGNGYAENKGYSPDVGEISLRIPDHLSQSTSEDAENVLVDSHKSYPRGRRRHGKHQKRQGFEREERRSRSELRSNSHFENEDECNGNSSHLTVSSKLDPHHNSTGTLDETSSDLRHSWPAFRKCREEDIALSPLPQPLEMTHCSEASVSPSAFRNYLSHRNLHLDPNLPPSPPVEQEDLITGNNLEDSTPSAKQLTRKVHALKKKIKLFEENFEKLYGYKPSNADKSSNIAVKKMLGELNKAKEDLRQLKQEPTLWSDDETTLNKSSRGTNTYCSQGLFAVTPAGAGTRSIEDSVKEAMEYLVRHRKSEKRPEALEEMNRDQLIAEKVLVQKVLLNFESMHGRPSSKAHRELVRPLYDRYRCTKRLIARMTVSKDPAELQPILEHETMDFPAADQVKEIDRNQSSIEQGESKTSQNPHEGKCVKNTTPPHINFHELSLSELTEELNQVREEKRKIRKILREFEEQFKKENRRKAQREDKRCMESFYTEYKNAKAKLKLLEALVAKREQTS